MLLKFHDLLDNTKCYEPLRELRWPEGIGCPRCGSDDVTRQGRDETERDKQRYHCKGCQRCFDDLSLSVFLGHHQPLKISFLLYNAV